MSAPHVCEACSACNFCKHCGATIKDSLTVPPLTRQKIDDIMTQHYPLESLLRENVDAFEACVRDIEKALGVSAAASEVGATSKEFLQVAQRDTQRLDWLEQNPGVKLERLRTTPRDGALLYWRIEDRDGEYVGGWTDPEDAPTLRAAIDEAMGRSRTTGKQP